MVYILKGHRGSGWTRGMDVAIHSAARMGMARATLGWHFEGEKLAGWNAEGVLNV